MTTIIKRQKPTNLSVSNKTPDTLDINSSNGLDATIPEATLTEAGLLDSADKAKLNNLTGINTGDQDLSGFVQTTDIDTLAELNSIVADATLIDTNDSRLSDARTPLAHTHIAIDITDFDTEVSNNTSVTANSAKVTNATHTGEITGATALTAQPILISNKNLVTAADNMEVLVNDSGTLKKVLASDFTKAETITTLDTPIVDNTDPLNPIVTLAYTNEDGSQLPVGFTFNIPTPVSVVNSIDLKPTANPNELTVEITYTDDNGNTQTITDTTPITIPSSSITNTITGNVIATHNDGVSQLVNIEETVTGFTVANDVITYTKEDGNTDMVTLVKTTDQIDKLLVANASVDVQNVNDNGIVTLTSERTDTGWVFASNTYEYTGTPDRVNITAQVHQAIANNVNSQRPSPVLELQKLIGATWTVLVTSATGYIRDANDHEESSNTIVFTDVDAGTNPQYRLVSRQDSAISGAVTVISGDMNLEAVEKITVVTSVGLN